MSHSHPSVKACTDVFPWPLFLAPALFCTTLWQVHEASGLLQIRGSQRYTVHGTGEALGVFQFKSHMVSLGPFYPWRPFMLSSLFCCNLITRDSPVIIKSIPIGQGAPFQHPFRADVTFELCLLSDKLEDRMKELIESFPVEVDNTNNL